MLLDFKISESDQRGRGSHMPSHVLDAIAESDPVPATLSALRKIKHVGKVLIQKHGPRIVSICNQYVKDLTSWDFNNHSMITGADLTGTLDTTKTENAIAIDSMTYLSFLRPPVPIGPVQDLFFSTCKQVLNEYNIVGKMSVDIETRPSRVQPTNNSNVVSNTDDLVPSSFIVSPLNARRASIEDIMRVSPGTSLQLLVPTHYKTKKKGTPMAVIAKNYCLQQGITDYTEDRLGTPICKHRAKKDSHQHRYQFGQDVAQLSHVCTHNQVPVNQVPPSTPPIRLLFSLPSSRSRVEFGRRSDCVRVETNN
jgi:hypothetical protein